jgi:UDP-sulfoquinovose synthase
VLNRFIILAALGQPLTVYGEGGQTRGLIDVRDTVECIRLAAEQPAKPGEYRVFNQMTESMSVLDLAKLVADLHPNAVDVVHLDNPRVEAESHYYKVTHTGLVELGLSPHLLSDTLLTSLYAVADRYKHRVDPAALRPTVRWRAAASR